jgi:hypothetical protein
VSVTKPHEIILGLGDSSESSIVAALTEIWQISEVEDGLVLDQDSMAAEVIRDRAAYTGLRLQCRAALSE